MNWVDPGQIWESTNFEHLMKNLGEILEDDMREIKKFYVGPITQPLRNS